MSLNRYIHIIVTLLIVVLLAGCRKDEIPSVPTGESVRLEAEIANTQSSTSTKATPSTETAGGKFEENDEFGFYLKSSTGYNTGNSNAKYVASKDKEGVIVYTAASPMSYFDHGLHTLYGYYPYKDGTTATTIDFTVKPDQRGNAVQEPILSNYTLSDLMWSSKVSVKPQTKFDDAIKLTFDHKLSNVIVTLKNRTNAKFSGEIPRIWLRDVLNKVSLNVESGIATTDATSKSDIELVPYQYVPEGEYVENTTTEIHYRAISVPQSFTIGTSVLKVNANKVTYQVKTTSLLTFEAGKQHQMNVTNTGVDFRLSGCSVNQWGSTVKVDGGTIGDDAVLPCLMLFNITSGAANTAHKAILNIDGQEFTSTEVALADNILKVTYDQGGIWGNKLINVAFYNSENIEINTNQKGQTLNWDIKGNPTDAAYSTIIGNVTFN